VRKSQRTLQHGTHIVKHITKLHTNEMSNTDPISKPYLYTFSLTCAEVNNTSIALNIKTQRINNPWFKVISDKTTIRAVIFVIFQISMEVRQCNVNILYKIGHLSPCFIQPHISGCYNLKTVGRKRENGQVRSISRQHVKFVYKAITNCSYVELLLNNMVSHTSLSKKMCSITKVNI